MFKVARGVGRLGALAIAERRAGGTVDREPEPMVMDDVAGVLAFDVADPVLQLPTYEVSARAVSRLAPTGATVLDLGSGTGRLLAHLARARPDLHIVGTDLSEEMLDHGRRTLASEGLADRVRLQVADMTALPGDLPPEPDVVSCVWALHHLPSEEHLRACLREIAVLRDRTGCAVWLYDFARLRTPGAPEALLALAPDAPEQLLVDGAASIRAAWSVDELQGHLRACGLSDLRGGAEHRLGHIQAWWSPRRDGRPSGDGAWSPVTLPRRSHILARRQASGLDLPG